MKILILKPSSLGDIVLALPVLRLLKKHLPHGEIYWWIETRFASLLEDDPDLAGIVRFDRQAWAAPQKWLVPLRSVQWVRRQKLDWVIDLQALARSAIFGWLARGELLIGLDDPRERAPGFYDVRVARPLHSRHAADWYLEVLRKLEVPIHTEFTWLPARPDIARQVREKWPVDNHRWIVLQPGARWPNKRWPAEHFGELVRQLRRTHPDRRFVILGSKDDQSLAQAICSVDQQRCLDLTGKSSLLETVEWIRSCELMVTNDTGPMHIGVALGRPLIALHGPTDPLRTGPYHRRQDALQLDLPCVPCLKSRCNYVREMECLRAISPEMVLAAVEDRLPK